jgi:hypothetical protein
MNAERDVPLSDAEKRAINNWIFEFNEDQAVSETPSVATIERIGPLPVASQAGYDYGVEYLESKLPAARERQRVGLSLGSRAPRDWITGVQYWEGLIAYLKRSRT